MELKISMFMRSIFMLFKDKYIRMYAWATM